MSLCVSALLWYIFRKVGIRRHSRLSITRVRPFDYIYWQTAIRWLKLRYSTCTAERIFEHEKGNVYFQYGWTFIRTTAVEASFQRIRLSSDYRKNEIHNSVGRRAQRQDLLSPVRHKISPVLLSVYFHLQYHQVFVFHDKDQTAGFTQLGKFAVFW